MLDWPRRAAGAIRKLFEPLQDVDVYVEDQNNEAFYRSLLRHATADKVRIARVFGLGGREAVIKAAAAYPKNARRALFIIDGDLHWVRGEPKPRVPRLHRHEAYCVENLLMCESALTFILSQETAITEEEAKLRMGYETWKTSIQSPLLSLFAAYAVASELDSTQQTVSLGVGNICRSGGKEKLTKLDISKANKARDAILASTEIKVSTQKVRERYGEILARLTSLRDPLMGVSGKDYLLPLIDFHLQSKGCKVRRKALRMRLTSSGSRARFAGLARALNRAARDKD